MKKTVSLFLVFALLLTTLSIHPMNVKAATFMDEATELSFPETLEGTLSAPDELSYSFTLESDGTVYFSADNYGDPNTNGAVNLYYTIYDENAVEIQAFHPIGTNQPSKDSIELKKGNYFLKLDVSPEQAVEYKILTSFSPKTTVSLSISLSKGSKLQLESILTPGKSSEKVTWSSSKKTVATVTSSGKVTAVNKGTATITARTSSGSKVSITIKVK